MDLIEQKGQLANAAIAIFVLGCVSVFFMVGMIGGFEISTLVGVGILALFVFGSMYGAVYIVFILIARGTGLHKVKVHSNLGLLKSAPKSGEQREGDQLFS